MGPEQLQILISQANAIHDNEVATLLGEEGAIDRKVRESFVPYPHMYVLCCLMDRQMNSNRAFEIPFKIGKIIGSQSLSELNKQPEEYYIGLFKELTLHRFNDKMANVFKHGLERIATAYHGDASNIWKGSPDSATVICRFLEFEGCGVKIATMATNILHRTFKIPFSEYSAIDVSPDVHVLRVMYRLGIISAPGNRDLAIYAMRGIYPSYPGLFDGLFWRIGREFCYPNKTPNCDFCLLKEICIKRIV